MLRTPALHTLVVVMGMSLLAACSTTRDSDATAPAGLSEVRAGGLDQLFIAPTVDFSQYRSLYIEPLEISYDESPRQDNLQRGPDAFRLDTAEREQLQKEFERALYRAWEERPGWERADKPAPGVLVLRTELEDFYLYASLKNNRPEPARTMARETSRFKLMAQLVDAESGALLLETRDRRVTGERGNGPGTLQSFSSVAYWNDFHNDIHSWGRQLARALTAR